MPEPTEELAREAEQEGNVHMANGLVLKARACYRRAESIRRALCRADR